MEEHADDDAPHAAPPAAAPSLKMMQWNAQGLRPKKHQTLTPADFEWRIAGYTLHLLPATAEGTRGCVTLVRSSIPHRRIADPVHCGDGMETLALKLHVGGLSLPVYNLYRSQRHQLEAGELLTMASHTSLLVAGDLNAHHPILQSLGHMQEIFSTRCVAARPLSATNPTGRHLAVLLEEVPYIRLLNTGEPTHVREGRLDLTLVSGDLAAGTSWQVHPTLTSDHYATLTTVTVAPPERDLTAAIQRAADAAIPKSSPGRRHRPNWWFYNEDVREHNHRVNLHRKLHEKRPNPTNLRLLQDLVTRARQVSQRARGWMFERS
ncbi:hypothetical protein GWK47_034479 [Chionoecetes opilio]|uniref:Endonuclease/exonuclease/phosphatase domain-containing protein n=1 Tax=Chionoecetes opilio TaxID=41210 RepID=A0A8J4YNZ0_CHIOP|nr:hypothetical protein GWK47_034479 [Chionoecetes opilio]